MKTTSILLILAISALSFSSCGRGGPATRVGRGIDHGVYKAGYGVKRAGQAIENAAR